MVYSSSLVSATWSSSGTAGLGCLHLSVLLELRVRIARFSGSNWAVFSIMKHYSSLQSEWVHTGYITLQSPLLLHHPGLFSVELYGSVAGN